MRFLKNSHTSAIDYPVTEPIFWFPNDWEQDRLPSVNRIEQVRHFAEIPS